MPLAHFILDLVLVGVVLYLISLIPMNETIKQIIFVVVIVAVVFWVISLLYPGFVPPAPFQAPRVR